MSTELIPSVDISFDDGWVDQLKWARYMHGLGLKGTFYVCPGLLGQDGRLTEEHVEMIASWGHRVANHTWEHEFPQRLGLRNTLRGLTKTREWLTARGYDGAVVALPKGSRTGQWTPEVLEAVGAEGFVGLRDVRFRGETSYVFAPRVAALELPDVMAVGAGLNAFYFHNNKNTSDDALGSFLTVVARWKDAKTVVNVLANSTGE